MRGIPGDGGLNGPRARRRGRRRNAIVLPGPAWRRLTALAHWAGAMRVPADPGWRSDRMAGDDLDPARFGSAFRAFMEVVVAAAAPPSSPLLERMQAHLGGDLTRLPVIAEE